VTSGEDGPRARPPRRLRERRRDDKRAALSALACLAGVLAVPTGAAATHRHSLVTGSGNCVVLAKQGGEPFVGLPDASFNNTTEPTTTMNPHPLHVHVHRGEPGGRLTIAVYGGAADPCAVEGNYLNGPP
jgi:hypothetical protein